MLVKTIVTHSLSLSPSIYLSSLPVSCACDAAAGAKSMDACATTHAPTRTKVHTTPAVEVLYENEEVVVINKPPQLPMDMADTTTPSVLPDTPVPERIRSVEKWATVYMSARGILDLEHAALEREQKRRKQLKFVHQLDAATSGVLCLAFTKSMASRLAHCFEAGTAEKTYVAVVAGHVPSTPHTHTRGQLDAFVQSLPVLHYIADDACRDEAANVASTPSAVRVPMSAKSSQELVTSASVVVAPEADPSTGEPPLAIRLCLPVGYDPSDAAHMRMAVGPQRVETSSFAPGAEGDGVEWRRRDRFRSAETLIEVVEHGFLWHPPTERWWPVTMLRLTPRTGRRHQLRVHCHALGHPIVGDSLYASRPVFQTAPPSPPAGASTAPSVPSDFPTQGWPRMYLHAQRLRLPCSLKPARSESERVALKKKRRRETLGLEPTIPIEAATEVSVFDAPCPFTVSSHAQMVSDAARRE